MKKRGSYLLLFLLAVAAVAGPRFVASGYYLHVAVLVMVYVMLALGLNVIVSCGLLDLGYIAFFAIGAYTYAILNTRFGVSFWFALPVAFSVCFIAGVLLAVVSLRSRSDYFALLTLAFGEIVRLFLRNADPLTNGPKGIMNIARPGLFWPVHMPLPSYYYYFALAGLAVAFYVVHRVTVSRVGAAWVGARDNEVWLASAGYHVLAVKISACALGAVLAGVAGVFFAAWQTFVAPESFVFLESIIVLCMVVLGGGVRGNLLGVAVGAVILALLPEIFREFQMYRMIAFGAGMTLIAVFKSSGLIGRPWSETADRKLFRATMNKPRPTAGDGRSEPGPASASLRIENLRKSFDGVAALGGAAGFSFCFEKGVLHGIIGLNGAGKTTLFNCLRGLLKPDSGRIWVDDVPLFAAGVDARAEALTASGSPGNAGRRLGGSPWRGRLNRLPPHRAARFIGATFQTPCNQEDMPAWKNVFLALRPLDGFASVLKELVLSLVPIHKRVDIECKERAVRFLVDVVGFPAASLETPVRELSFAERRKVELAKAFAPGKPIALLDEPTAGLNEAERARFIDLIAAMSKGRTVAVIEHNHAALGKIADQTLFMENGDVGREEGRPIVGAYASVMASPRVREVYLGRLSADRLGKRQLPAAEPILQACIDRAGYVEGAAVLDHVDLAVPRGSIVGLVGLNGAGKTTLLRCLVNSAEVPYLNGTVRMNKRGGMVDLVDRSRGRSLPTYRIAGEGVFLVRQEQKLFPTMTVEENLRFGATTQPRRRAAESEASAAWFLERIFKRAFASAAQTSAKNGDNVLRGVLSRRASQLSGGQQQLLAIGRALVAAGLDPGRGPQAGSGIVLLLDEPTSGLQPSLAQLVVETVELLRDECGVTVVITEQGLELSHVADRVFLLESGRLVDALS